MFSISKSHPQNAILSISSHVIRGSVGNRISTAIFEASGYTVWELITTILAWHPGQGGSTRHNIPDDVFTAYIDDVLRSPQRSKITAVFSGYLASVKQAKEIARLVRTLKSGNSNLVYHCDPVIGDLGSLYVDQEIANAIRDKLVPVADLITPNRFELSWLTGSEALELSDCVAVARMLACTEVIVTSALEVVQEQKLINIFVNKTEAIEACHSFFENAPKGTGDAFAALFLANRLNGLPNETNLKQTGEFIGRLIQMATQTNNPDLTVESIPKLIRSNG